MLDPCLEPRAIVGSSERKQALIPQLGSETLGPPLVFDGDDQEVPIAPGPVGDNDDHDGRLPYSLAVAESEVARMRTSLPALSERIKEHNLTLVAAGVAFYAFLAFVPALVAFISIYGLVANPDDVTRQVQDIASALPKEVQDFLVFQLTSITNANRAGVSLTLVIAIALALWSASGGMAALITGIHVANGEEQVGGFVAKRGKALGLTIAAMLLLGVVILMIAAVPALLDKAGLGIAVKLVLTTLRWPLLAVVMICGVALLYKVASREGSRRLARVHHSRRRRRDPRVARRVSRLRVLHVALLELQQDVRRTGIDRRGAALALAQLVGRPGRLRSRWAWEAIDHEFRRRVSGSSVTVPSAAGRRNPVTCLRAPCVRSASGPNPGSNSRP